MKKYAAFFFFFFICCILCAQPWPRQEQLIVDNNKQITDANVSLFSLHSDYDFPYIIPSKANITEKLIRIASFLERSTMKEFIDPGTGKPITDFKKLPPDFKSGESDFRPYSYEWGVTYSGMLQAAAATKNDLFLNYAAKRLQLIANAWPRVEIHYKTQPSSYQPFLHSLFRPHNLDACGAMCAAAIRMQMTDPNHNWRPFIDNSLDFITSKQHRLADSTLARNHPYENTLWLDDLYMSIPALAEAYRLTGRPQYIDDAATQVLNFAKRMFVAETGLFMHGWVESMEHNPRFYWGRANGWAILAVCDLLDVLPSSHPKYNEILSLFKKHCEGLLKVQSGKGMWYQLLDRNDSYLESSCTAMFVYGFARGINKGWLDGKSFGAAAITGWNALSDQINNMGQIENVCVGTSVAFEPAYYYNRHVHPYTAHGYGPVLLAGSQMIQLVKDFKIIQESTIYFHNSK